MAAHPMPHVPMTPRADLPTIGGAGYSDADQPIGVGGARSFSDTVDVMHRVAKRAHTIHRNKVHAAGAADMTTQSDGSDFSMVPQL